MPVTTPSTPKQYVELVRAILDAMDADLIDPSTGAFKQQPDYKDDLQLAQDIEQAYVAHGGVISDSVAKVISGLSVVVTFLKP